MRYYILAISLTISLLIFAQQSNNKRQIILHEVSNKEIVQSVFPEAAKVEKENDYLYKIIGNKNKIIGYALTSEKYCKNITGYNNTTPVMIILDKNRIIKKISMLSHYETLSYVKKLENNGFFNSWNDLKVKNAQKIIPDGYTGATMTAVAVKKNVDFLLEIMLGKQ